MALKNTGVSQVSCSSKAPNRWNQRWQTDRYHSYYLTQFYGSKPNLSDLNVCSLWQFSFETTLRLWEDLFWLVKNICCGLPCRDTERVEPFIFGKNFATMDAVVVKALVSDISNAHHSSGSKLLWVKAQLQRKNRTRRILQSRSCKDHLEVKDSGEEQLSSGSCLVMVRKLIQLSQVMEIAFKPLANNPQEIKGLLGLIKSDNLIHSSFTLKEHLPAVCGAIQGKEDKLTTSQRLTSPCYLLI